MPPAPPVEGKLLVKRKNKSKQMTMKSKHLKRRRASRKDDREFGVVTSVYGCV
jgi:hypothetical protein